MLQIHKGGGEMMRDDKVDVAKVVHECLQYLVFVVGYAVCYAECARIIFF